MKAFIYFGLVILFSMKTMAELNNTALINKLKSLPDRTYQVIAQQMPSVLISSPGDSRIDKFSETEKSPFLVRSEVSTNFVVVINPKKREGWFFWKKPAKLVFPNDRFAEILKGHEALNLEEASFINELEGTSRN